jgi:ferredoxin--NADP+ reductase
MSDAIRHLEDYDTGMRYAATVVSSERITPTTSDDEVRELILDVDCDVFDFNVGQSIGVIAPGDPALGEAQHFRLYSVADLPQRGASGRPRICLCVRRCSYIDEYSGEEYKGIGSNFLCDRQPGDKITVTGPVGLPFEVPEEKGGHLILIGSGTGIAPFRAFIKHLYRDVKDWHGRVWLFYGARSGLEMLYMNDERDDFSLYYDEETFEAFRALSPRPSWSDPIAWDRALGERGEELWRLLEDPRTTVYVAGLEEMLEQLNEVFTGLAGSKEKWGRRKAELMAGGRWVELVY